MNNLRGNGCTRYFNGKCMNIWIGTWENRLGRITIDNMQIILYPSQLGWDNFYSDSYWSAQMRSLPRSAAVYTAYYI